MCVQRFDDSLNSAIHTTYRISLRSSSMPEPRDPLLKVVTIVCFGTGNARCKKSLFGSNGRLPRRGRTEGARKVRMAVVRALRGPKTPQTSQGLFPLLGGRDAP